MTFGHMTERCQVAAAEKAAVPSGDVSTGHTNALSTGNCTGASSVGTLQATNSSLQVVQHGRAGVSPSDACAPTVALTGSSSQENGSGSSGNVEKGGCNVQKAKPPNKKGGNNTQNLNNCNLRSNNNSALKGLRSEERRVGKECRL